MSPRKKNTVPDIVEAFKVRHAIVRAPEVATHVVDVALEELGIARAVYDETEVARPVIWRGAMSWTRDVLKRREHADESGDTAAAGREDEDAPMPDEAQGALFDDDFTAMIRVVTEARGEYYKRRADLNQEEAAIAIDLLREQLDVSHAKVARLATEYEQALPYWQPGMTWLEAYRRAQGDGR